MTSDLIVYTFNCRGIVAATIDQRTRDFIRDHRVARLATADAAGRPLVVPICYVFDGDFIYSPIDEKPKAVEGPRLGRVRNIEANPRVALVIDDYFEDWNKLVYVLISGRAAIVTPAAAPANTRAPWRSCARSTRSTEGCQSTAVCSLGHAG